MCNSALQDMLDELQPKINRLAYMFLKKMHRPSPYAFEDLLNEAAGVVIEKVNDCQYREEGSATLGTYILTGVRFHFINLVKKSYKMDFNPKIANKRKLNRLKRDLTFAVKYPESDSLNVVFEIMEKLSDREIKYISLIIFPPKHVIEKGAVAKTVRNTARTNLNMSVSEELIIRKKVKTLLI
jgi:hypothetical protein